MGIKRMEDWERGERCVRPNPGGLLAAVAALLSMPTDYTHPKDSAYA